MQTLAAYDPAPASVRRAAVVLLPRGLARHPSGRLQDVHGVAGGVSHVARQGQALAACDSRQYPERIGRLESWLLTLTRDLGRDGVVAAAEKRGRRLGTAFDAARRQRRNTREG